MPTYVYHCDRCEGDLEQNRKIQDRDRLTLCERCKIPMDRKIAVFEGAVYAPTSTGGGLR